MDVPPSIQEMDRQAPAQNRIWLASRIAWFCMVAVLVLAGAGLFGEGWLASAEARAADGSLRLAYDRFQRTDAMTEMTVTVARPGDFSLCLDRAFLGRWRVAHMEPAPAREEAGQDEVCYLVHAADGVAAPFVRIFATPRATSLSAEGRLRLAGGVPLRLRVLIWP